MIYYFNSEKTKVVDENVSDAKSSQLEETSSETEAERTTSMDSQDLFAKLFSTKGNDKVDKYGYMSPSSNNNNNGPCTSPCANNNNNNNYNTNNNNNNNYNTNNNNNANNNNYNFNSNINSNNNPSYGSSYINLPTLVPLPSTVRPNTLPTLVPLPTSGYNNNNGGSFAQQQCHRVNVIPFSFYFFDSKLKYKILIANLG